MARGGADPGWAVPEYDGTPPKPSRLTPLLGSMLLIPLVMASMAMAFTGQAIEDDLIERSEKALASAGLDAVAVSFDGRDAVLTGVPDRNRDRASGTVAGVDGVRVVELAEATGTLTFAVARTTLTVAGQIPDERSRERVIGGAEDSARDRELVDELTVVAGVLLPGNPDQVGALISGFAREWEGSRKLTWSAAGVRITGEVPDDVTRTAVAEAATKALPGITVDSELESSEAKLQARITEYIAANPVEFRPYTAELTANGAASVRHVAGLLRQAPDVEIRVHGRVELSPVARTGSSPYQRKLSGQRAETVKALLVSLGVGAERITTRALGQDGADPGRRADITIH
ncbi:MAG: OmpA family protein [Micromonosporaceae bacterium]